MRAEDKHCARMRKLQIFISHSAHDDEWATKVRQELVRQINRKNGYEALVDEASFKPGDQWRPILHQWLADADGAILILTKSALKSSWVHKEAMILDWRRLLQSDVRVVPVLLDVSMEDVASVWGDLQIGESQAVRFRRADEFTAGAIAEKIVAGFADLGDCGDDGMRRWAAGVAGLLEKLPEPFLQFAAEQLRLDRPELTRRQLCLAIGHALLHADIAQSERCIMRARPGLQGEARSLVEHIIPTSIPAEIATPFLRAMNQIPSRGVLLANARRKETGLRIVSRATCCEAGIYPIEVCVSGSANPEDAIYADVVEQIKATVGLPESEVLKPWHVESVPGEVVIHLWQSKLSGASSRTVRAVVDRIRRTFPTVTLVVSIERGEDVRLMHSLLQGAVVSPEWDAGQELLSLMFATRLTQMVQRGY